MVSNIRSSSLLRNEILSTSDGSSFRLNINMGSTKMVKIVVFHTTSRLQPASRHMIHACEMRSRPLLKKKGFIRAQPFFIITVTGDGISGYSRGIKWWWYTFFVLHRGGVRLVLFKIMPISVERKNNTFLYGGYGPETIKS